MNVISRILIRAVTTRDRQVGGSIPFVTEQVSTKEGHSLEWPFYWFVIVGSQKSVVLERVKFELKILEHLRDGIAQR